MSACTPGTGGRMTVIPGAPHRGVPRHTRRDRQRFPPSGVLGSVDAELGPWGTATPCAPPATGCRAGTLDRRAAIAPVWSFAGP